MIETLKEYVLADETNRNAIKASVAMLKGINSKEFKELIEIDKLQIKNIRYTLSVETKRNKLFNELIKLLSEQGYSIDFSYNSPCLNIEKVGSLGNNQETGLFHYGYTDAYCYISKGDNKIYLQFGYFWMFEGVSISKNRIMRNYNFNTVQEIVNLINKELGA